MKLLKQIVRNTSASVSTASIEILPANIRRKLFSIVSLTAGVTTTIAKGDVPAVANNGIVLSQGQGVWESDGENFQCWKGAIQVIASGAGTIAISEMMEE